jgi:hypothetical protein
MKGKMRSEGEGGEGGLKSTSEGASEEGGE